MNILGIIAAKAKSLRFPGKNRHIYQGHPLFWHSVSPLLTSRMLQDVIVSTDCPDIQSYCADKKVEVYPRLINAIENDAPLLQVLKQVCLNYPKPFDYVITIMANCPGHTDVDVKRALNKITSDKSINEIRSFDRDGNETGLMVFKKKVIMENSSISSHLAAIETNGFEVHFKTDLEDTSII